MAKLIAFQGEPGAFSHAAAHAVFPRGEPVPCATFEDTIQAVKTGKADYGLVPVENSLYGRITDIYHLLPESGLFITGEHFLRIEMNLLGLKGTTLKDIKSVQSLNVALGQCRAFMATIRSAISSIPNRIWGGRISSTTGAGCPGISRAPPIATCSRATPTSTPRNMGATA